jgi:TIR domain
MKEISARLSPEEFSIIDLTLNQFSLPSSESWSGSKVDYILRMIENGSDTTLVDLGSHLGFSFEDGSTSKIEPVFWEKGKFRLFISHLSTYREWAAELQNELIPFGISSFVAHNDIAPTVEWQTQIELGLSTCDSLIALLHPAFHTSQWTDQEIGFAMGRGVPVYSIRLGEVPYGFIGRFQAFNGVDKDPKKVALEVFNAYRKNKQTQKRLSEVLVNMFAQSQSFAEAKERIGHLEDLEVWETMFSIRMTSAIESNSQIIDSWGVVERAKKLLKKWDKKPREQ